MLFSVDYFFLYIFSFAKIYFLTTFFFFLILYILTFFSFLDLTAVSILPDFFLLIFLFSFLYNFFFFGICIYFSNGSSFLLFSHYFNSICSIIYLQLTWDLTLLLKQQPLFLYTRVIQSTKEIFFFWKKKNNFFGFVFCFVFSKSFL